MVFETRSEADDMLFNRFSNLWHCLNAIGNLYPEERVNIKEHFLYADNLLEKFKKEMRELSVEEINKRYNNNKPWLTIKK